MASIPDWVSAATAAHRADLLRYAHSLCRDPGLAEDAVQETLLRLAAETPAKVEGHLAGWLFRVCRTRVVDLQRKLRRLTPLDPATLPAVADLERPSPAEAAEQEDMAGLIWRLIGELTPTQAEMVRLKFQAQLSYREIAEVTGKSVNAVGVHLHTALATLRSRLAEQSDWQP